MSCIGYQAFYFSHETYISLFRDVVGTRSTKLKEVNKTIEDLRKQLSEAESKATGLDSEISSYKRSVHHVRSKYSRQLGRLEKKEHSVKESRADWESEKVSIEKAKAAHEGHGDTKELLSQLAAHFGTI